MIAEDVAPFGACKPVNVRPNEVRAIGRVMRAIEAGLEQPIGVDDRIALMLLAQLLLLQRRAFRKATRGIETKAGGVRPIVTEFRALSRAVVETLDRLRFLRGIAPPSLDDLFAPGATIDAPGGAEAAEPDDRAAADVQRGDGGTVGER